MTLLTNYYGNTKGTALKIRMTTAYIGVSINILISSSESFTLFRNDIREYKSLDSLHTIIEYESFIL